MADRRVIFLLKPLPSPSGGVAAIYRHVEILNTHGVPAFVALRKKPKVDFYRTTAPQLIFGNALLGKRASLRRQVRAGDIWVVPEVYPDYIRMLEGTPAKRLMLCQNHYFLPLPLDSRGGIDEFSVHGVIATTESIQSFFRDVYSTPVPYLHSYAIDPQIFAPALVKKRQIAYMPRKLSNEDVAFLIACFKRRHASYSGVPWVKIADVPQSEAARIMGESGVFLSLSHKDSLGLPPLEAMACGCLVAGYHGDGGRTFMTPDNGWWADTGDWKACIDGLAAALAVFDSGGDAVVARRRAMAATVAHYGLERLERDVVSFWRQELASPFP